MMEPYSIDRDSIASDSRIMLLEQKSIEDRIAAFVQYVPSIFYVITSLVYTPLMFSIGEPYLKSALVAFVVEVFVIWLVFTLRSLMARRTQRLYEMVALRRPSEPHSTVEMIWADRLAEMRQYREYYQRSVLFSAIEVTLWFCFAIGIYFLALKPIGP
jgi:hypothetical protein